MQIEKINNYIDSHLDEHVEKIQQLLRQPSSSKTDPEGTRKCADLLKQTFSDLGCKEAKTVETGGYPVAYGEYNAGAEKSMIVYMMYDTQPFKEDEWISPPLEAKLVDIDPFGKCIVARGATNSKGPLRAFLNAVESIQTVESELPVNLLFVAEGEEELRSKNLPVFITKYKEKLKKADAAFFPSASQDHYGKVKMSLGCKGAYGLVLECKGGTWGGPAQFDIHSSNQAWVDSPVWRMIQALSTMYDANKNKILIDNWHDNVAPPSKEDIKVIDKLLKTFDEKSSKESLKVERFIDDLHGKELLLRYLYSTTLTILHMHAGSPFPDSKNALGVVPHKITARLHIRLVPNQNAEEVVPKIRAHLDKRGYKDIEISDAAGYTWSKTNIKAGIVQSLIKTYQGFSYEPEIWPHSAGSAPYYLFNSKEWLNVPFVGGGLGHGGRAHAPNEYFVIQGGGKVQGLAGCEKSFVALIDNFAKTKDALSKT